MYLDPDALTRRALEISRDPALLESEIVLDADFGFSQDQRRLVRSVLGALCEELTKMFADGVGLELIEQGMTEADIDRAIAEARAEGPAEMRDDPGVGEQRLEGRERDLVADIEHDIGGPLPTDADQVTRLREADELTLQDPDASAVAGMSWTQLQKYASSKDIDLYDRTGEKPTTKSKATILAELGITKEA